MSERIAVLLAVLRHSRLRNLEAAFLLFGWGEWSTYVAIVIYAYTRGGAAEAGVVAFLSLAPSIVVVPAVTTLGDRGARTWVLFGSYASQAVFMAGAAVALIADAPSPIVYVLAIGSATAVSTSRPLNASILPEVVHTPDDLTAANVVAGMAESAGTLTGPLGAGLIVATAGPEGVFVAAAIGATIAAAIVAIIAIRAQRPMHVALIPRTGARSELLGGLRAIWADPRLRSIVVVAAWSTFLVGALDVLFAVLAIDLLDLGASGVGYLGAVSGLGVLVGSAGAIGLVGRERLGLSLLAAGAVFGGALATIAISSGTPAALILLIASGVGSGLTNVIVHTLIQRLAGDDVMSRVFGMLQGLMMGSTALGSLAVPVLITLVGERGVFAAAGLSLPLAIVLAGRPALAADPADAERARELRVLRGIPMLAPLSGPVLERLAGGLIPVMAPATTAVVREGEAGDRFFVVVDGRLQVNVGGQDVRTLGPGDSFGEIALVRHIPRTATVTAISNVALLALDQETFLDALGGQARSRSIAIELSRQRLADDQAQS
jgi:MFS family permease